MQPSEVQVPTDRKREIREEQRAGSDHQGEPAMNSSFVTKELEDASTTLICSYILTPQQEETTAAV